jgi:carboxyl-terminal processing protease
MPPRTLRDLPLFRAEVVHGYLPLQLAADDHVEWGRTADGVGYVYIGSFADGTWGYDLDPVLAALRDVRALIVDVRHNGGGSTTPADAILGRFLRAERPAPPMFRHGQPQAARSLYPRGPFTWQKPVVLLIDGVSFSAAEYFADALRQEPIVTVVGRATGGGGGNYGYYPLPSGTRLRLPWQEFRRLDGQEIEWTGVSPDLEVVQDPDHLAAGKDDQLEAALALARR